MQQLRRTHVFQYDKSGKLAAIFSRNGGYSVVELSPNMNEIMSVRLPRYIKGDVSSATKYQVEMIETVEDGADDTISYSYRLLRILSPEDLDEDRWMNTVSLNELPVLSEPIFTKEEKLWAGKREGNLGQGIGSVVIAIFAAWVAVEIYFDLASYKADSQYVFIWSAIAATAVIVSVIYPWKMPRSANREKLQHLTLHKERLRQRAQDLHTAAKTKFEKALEDYDYWESLSPQKFELGVSLRLEKEGYKVQTTQYAKDGGVDIHAVDDEGAAMIVQAKQHSSNVGVAVVREIIGVRESSPAKPKALIFSLVGFTRGARELAEKEGVELRDIKSELLGI